MQIRTEQVMSRGARFTLNVLSWGLLVQCVHRRAHQTIYQGPRVYRELFLHACDRVDRRLPSESYRGFGDPDPNMRRLQARLRTGWAEKIFREFLSRYAPVTLPEAARGACQFLDA